ncbi:hypothetical protein D917_06264 [Trichinella nativa]|uniref:Uncharacterized protein n=1 Tax=Trichinella nativa TaxID=6335 RepID=A0A1Y3EYZ2_9BILA|nr:hypothetical protein D917_06264 [Trichinella nativa]
MCALVTTERQKYENEPFQQKRVAHVKHYSLRQTGKHHKCDAWLHINNSRLLSLSNNLNMNFSDTKRLKALINVF